MVETVVKERYKQILDIIDESERNNQIAFQKYIKEKLGVSIITIRVDLRVMEELGYIERENIGNLISYKRKK